MSTTVTRNVHVAVRPEGSVAVTVTVLAPKLKILPDGGLYVTVAEQLSVAVAVYDTTARHWPGAVFTVMGAGQVTTGFCRSVIVTVKEHIAVLPEASVTRKTFVVVPTGKTEPLGRPDNCATTAPGQLSVVVGNAYETGRPHRPAEVPKLILAGQFILGASTSRTVTRKVCVEESPHGSVAVTVTTVVPTGNVLPEVGAYEIEAEQLSKAVATKVTGAPHCPGAELAVISAGATIVGG